jgi:hypothetical protein
MGLFQGISQLHLGPLSLLVKSECQMGAGILLEVTAPALELYIIDN